MVRLRIRVLVRPGVLACNISVLGRTLALRAVTPNLTVFDVISLRE